MEFTVNKMQIELLNLTERYRDMGVPVYVINGMLAQEMLRMKQREMSEFTVAMNDKIKTLNGQIEQMQSQSKEADDGQSVSEPS